MPKKLSDGLIDLIHSMRLRSSPSTISKKLSLDKRTVYKVLKSLSDETVRPSGLVKLNMPSERIYKLDNVNNLDINEMFIHPIYQGDSIEIVKEGPIMKFYDGNSFESYPDDKIGKFLQSLKDISSNYVFDAVISRDRLYVIDVISFEGEDTTILPLKMRLEYMDRFTDTDNIVFMNRKDMKGLIAKKGEYEAAVQKLLDSGFQDGVILKDMDSVYSSENNKNRGWYEYLDPNVLDVTILNKKLLSHSDSVSTDKWARDTEYLVGLGPVDKKHALFLGPKNITELNNTYYSNLGNIVSKNRSYKNGDVLRIQTDLIRKHNRVTDSYIIKKSNVISTINKKSDTIDTTNELYLEKKKSIVRRAIDMLLTKRVERRGDKWVVTDRSGSKVLGTHDDEEDAKEQSRAIEANKSTKAKVIDGFESPEPGDIPDKAKDILASAYASCRNDGGSKERCSKIAWGAVRNAGFEPAKESVAKSKKQIPGVSGEEFDELVSTLRRQPGIKDPEALAASILRDKKKKKVVKHVISDIAEFIDKKYKTRYKTISKILGLVTKKNITNETTTELSDIIIKKGFILKDLNDKEGSILIRMKESEDKHSISKLLKEYNIESNYNEGNSRATKFEPMFDLILRPREDGSTIAMREVAKSNIEFNLNGKFGIVRKSASNIPTAEKGDIYIAGYASVPVVDREGEKIPISTLQKMHDGFMAEDEIYQNGMVEHENLAMLHVLKEPITDINGNELVTHVDEGGWFIVAKVRESPYQDVIENRRKVLSGEIDSFSIGGRAVNKEFVCDISGNCEKQITDLQVWEPTMCHDGMNQVSKFDIIPVAN